MRKLIFDKELDCFIVSSQESIYYLTGATYKPLERPFLIVIRGEGEPVFLVPKLEEEHMRKSRIGEVVSYWEYPAPPGNNWYDKLAEILGKEKKIGVEPTLPVQNKLLIKKIVESNNGEVLVLPLIENLRLVKSAGEIEMIRIAAQYADKGMKLMLDNVYYGATVLEMFALSKNLQIELIKTGNFDPLESEFLTACWPAPFSALPHGIPDISDRLEKGPIVAMSFHRVNGYAAECERTFFLTEPSLEEKEFFDVMISAREKAFEQVKAGVPAADVDHAAMDYLRDAGMKKYLLHRTGHGIGLGNHEGPWVAEGSQDILEENMVISVEPGIYVPGLGGFRHSDTVLVKKNGYEVLTQYPTDLKSLIIRKKRLFKKIKGKLVQTALKLNKRK